MKTKIELLNEAMYDAGRNNQNDPVMDALHDAAGDQLDESMHKLGIEWGDLTEEQKHAAVLQFKEGFWSNCISNTEQLLRRVMKAAHDAAESWQDGDLGLDLAYLVHAVLTEDSVQWPDDRPILRLFRELFPEGGEIWKHITVQPS